jgi:hypothetical protein
MTMLEAEVKHTLGQLDRIEDQLKDLEEATAGGNRIEDHLKALEEAMERGNQSQLNKTGGISRAVANDHPLLKVSLH